MAVAFQVDFILYQVGTDDFLHSFFSTISHNLEPNGWGTKFPLLMKKLYVGKLEWSDVPEAIEEVKKVKSELIKFDVDKVIWDIDDLSKQPPWGTNISSEITSLANYFVTSDGRDLFDVLQKAMQDSLLEHIDLEVVSI